jgi:hypothetical protein
MIEFVFDGQQVRRWVVRPWLDRRASASTVLSISRADRHSPTELEDTPAALTA